MRLETYGKGCLITPRSSWNPQEPAENRHLGLSDDWLVGTFGMTTLEKIAGEDSADRHVIFFHGLRGDWKGTWTNNEGQAWPGWLAEDLGVCVWSVSYPARPTKWTGQSMDLSDRGDNIAALLLAQSSLRGKTLCLVAHSLGGLVVKQALRSLEYGIRPPEARLLLSRVDKICFIAVPHFGADLAKWVRSRRWLLRPNVVVSNLTRDNRALFNLNLWYRGWAETSVEHLILYETQPLKVGFWRFSFLVVPPSSSDPGVRSVPISVDKDHCSIVQVKSRKCYVYDQLLAFLAPRAAVGSVADAQKEIAKHLRNPADAVNFLFPPLYTTNESGDGDLPDKSRRREYSQQAASFLADIALTNDAAIVQERRAAGAASIAAAVAEIGFKRDDPALVGRAVQKLEEAIASFPCASPKQSYFVELREGILRRR